MRHRWPEADLQELNRSQGSTTLPDLARLKRDESGIFNSAYLPYLDNPTRTQIYFGGSSSGKSVFLAQRDVYAMLQGGRNFLICRAVGKDSRRSTFIEIVRVIRDWNLSEHFQINKTDMSITCSNGYQFLFAGLDDTEKIKSIIPLVGVITDIRIEEATQTHSDAIAQLYKRQRGGDDDTPKRLTLSFNPIYRTHPIFTQYFEPIGWTDDQTEYTDGSLTIFKTTYKDNEFLTAGDVFDLENEKDEYYYNVYTLGNWGVLGDVIFKNWRIEDLSEKKKTFDNHRFGLDFGYSVDPAALSCSHYDKRNKTIYVYDEVYVRELTNDVLAATIKPIVGKSLVMCDSAEPKSIAELQLHGINAIGAKKGKDSIMHGIQWLQQQTIVVDPSCVNTINELSLYQWKEDRFGEPLPKPQDKHNHLIDGKRYAYENDMMAGRVVVAENNFY